MLSTNSPSRPSSPGDGGISWVATLPFIGLHVMALGVFWVGWSPVAILVCLALYWVRMFAVTGFYHRYLSHRSYKTSRWFQFLFAVVGNSSTQKGPLW
ncbi:MAG TPA: acyl-CoA desaturase, partial [Vicinamibacteria bacterium]